MNRVLVDEVLAVGHEHVRQNRFARMQDVRRRDTTVVLVSHEVATVERMCDRACLLVHGRLDLEGEAGKVVAHYREVLAGERRGVDPRSGRS